MPPKRKRVLPMTYVDQSYDIVYPTEPVIDEHLAKCAECEQDIPDEVHDYLCANCRTALEIEHLRDERKLQYDNELEAERRFNRLYTDEEWETMRQEAMQAGYEQAIQ